MKRGLTLADIPRKRRARGWFSFLLEEFLASGDEVWEITDAVPNGDVENARNRANPAAHRHGCRVSQRGNELFLIRVDS